MWRFPKQITTHRNERVHYDRASSQSQSGQHEALPFQFQRARQRTACDAIMLLTWHCLAGNNADESVLSHAGKICKTFPL
jgi:hypothetical protein